VKKIKGFTLVELLVVVSIIAILLAVLMPAMSKAREIAKRTICSSQIKQIGVGMAAYAMGFDDKMPWSGGIKNDVPDDSVDESSLHPFTVYRCGHPGKSGNDDVYQDKSTACACGAIGTYGKPIAMRLGCLFAGKFIQDGKVFYCPSAQGEDRRYDSYTLVSNTTAKIGGNTQWGMPHQAYNLDVANSNDWIRVGYDYYPIDRKITGRRPYDGMTTISSYRVPIVSCKKFSNLSSTLPYATDTIWSKDSVTHCSGKKVVGTKTILRSAGLNCVFKDGHVDFVKDKTGNSSFDSDSNNDETLFDNQIWKNASPTDEESDHNVKAAVFYYYMYRFIGSPGTIKDR